MDVSIFTLKRPKTRNALSGVSSLTVFQMETVRCLRHSTMCYKAGYSVKEIMERTGYRGKSNIYRILHQYDIKMEYPSMSRTSNKVKEKSI